MKRQKEVPGLFLLGIGLYYLLKQLHVTPFENFYSWPTFLCIIGIPILFQAYHGKNAHNILPGFLFVGLGIHFHSIHYFSFWPGHLEAFLLILAFGMLLTYQKTKTNLFTCLFFFVIATILLFHDHLMRWIDWFEGLFSFLNHLWPIVIILLSLYLLFIKKK